jgi:hypothetical protein
MVAVIATSLSPPPLSQPKSPAVKATAVAAVQFIAADFFMMPSSTDLKRNYSIDRSVFN